MPSLCADYSSRVHEDLSAESSGASGLVPEDRAPLALRLAVGLIAVAGLALVAVGVVSVLQFHGRFSLGIGAMLLIYGASVIGVAWLGRRHHPLAYGAMTFVTILHGFVIGSTAYGSRAWWLWLLLVPVVFTIGCLIHPDTRRTLGHYTERDLTD